MKQQESNLFDKGMSLDTNPIAMDNHTLSGALNATMITMNGNELVLQNDMGNARVETAYLPDGFVPVGMKEYGGIVYVASYNPINGQSLIGSFPSPERNISNEDTGQPALTFTQLDNIVSSSDTNQEVKHTYAREAVLIPSDLEKDKDILRPGDQIAFYGQRSSGLKAYSTLSAIIVDSDNNSIDITKDIIADTNNLPATLPTDIPYYKGKISGKVYLVETLKLPTYLSVAVGGDKVTSTSGEGDNVTTTESLSVTITPSVDDPNFLSSYSYKLDYILPNGTTASVTIAKDGSYTITSLPLTGKLRYTVTLRVPYGIITSISRSGVIDLSKVGTGEVDFKYFFYYNDIKKELIQFDYDIMAYLKDNQEIEECYLLLSEYKLNETNVFSRATATHKIDLPIESMAGNFSSIIAYGSGSDKLKTKIDDVEKELAATLAMGKIYYGTLNVVTVLGTSSETKTAETPLCIITSSITNEYYMDNSTGNMSDDENFMSLMSKQAADRIKIQISSKVDWTQSEQLTISKETGIPGITNDSPIISEHDEGYVASGKKLVKYAMLQETNVVLTATPKVELLYPDESFPLDAKINIECSADESEVYYSTDLSWTASNNSLQSDIEKSTESGGYNITLEKAVEEIHIATKDENNVITNNASSLVEWLSSTTNNNIAITFKNTLFTKFYGELGDEEEYANNNADAMVPYMNVSDEPAIEQMLGCPILLRNAGEYETIRPESWFSFSTWESGKNNRNRKIAIMRAPEWYTDVAVAGGIPSQGETNEWGGTALFHTTSTNANWNFYSKCINDYYHNDLNAYPSLLFLSGVGEDGGTTILDEVQTRAVKNGNTIVGWVYGGMLTRWNTRKVTWNYAIPIMFSTQGDLYMLNEWDELGGTTESPKEHPLYKILTTLSKIYILLSNQVLAVNFRRTKDYIYIMPYTITVNVPVKANVSIGFPGYYTPKNGSTAEDDNAQVEFDSVKWHLPIFTLNPSDTEGKLPFEYEASYSLSNPDIYTEIESFINAEFELGACAIVPNANGEGYKVITSASWNGNKESIDSSHPYYFDGTNLIDCYAHEVTSCTFANYLHKSKQHLVIRKDVNNEYNTIYVNKTSVGKILEKNENINRTIGTNEGKETMFGDIAPNHVIKPIFGLSRSLTMKWSRIPGDNDYVKIS